MKYGLNVPSMKIKFFFATADFVRVLLGVDQFSLIDNGEKYTTTNLRKIRNESYWNETSLFCPWHFSSCFQIYISIFIRIISLFPSFYMVWTFSITWYNGNIYIVHANGNIKTFTFKVHHILLDNVHTEISNIKM